MSIVVCAPDKLSELEKSQILALIISGEQVQVLGLEERLLKAVHIAFKVSEENKIISTATLKNPNLNYKSTVFKEAGASNDELYPYELGYIATHSEYENRGYCKEVLSAFLFDIEKPMYATTRKPSMIHILKKFGFVESGTVYKKDLVLLVRPK